MSPLGVHIVNVVTLLSQYGAPLSFNIHQRDGWFEDTKLKYIKGKLRSKMTI